MAFAWSSAFGGDGAEQEADRRPGIGLKVLAILEALGDQHRVLENDERAQHHLRGLARVHLLELFGRDAVAQDRLHDVRITSLWARMAPQLSSIATSTMS